MIAIARVSVNHDGRGGTAPDRGPKVRNLAIRVTVDLVSLPGPLSFLGGPWIVVDTFLVLILLPSRTILVF